MQTYHIEVSLKIKRKESYNEIVIASSEVNQAVTVPARDVRKAATSIVRQAVDNMSRSTETGLAEIIAQEPIEVGSAKEPEALSI